MEIPKDILGLIAAKVRESYNEGPEDYIHCKYNAMDNMSPQHCKYISPRQFILSLQIYKPNAADVDVSFILQCGEEFRPEVSLYKQKIFLMRAEGGGTISLNELQLGHNQFDFNIAAKKSAEVRISVKEEFLRQTMSSAYMECRQSSSGALCRISVLILCKIVAKAAREREKVAYVPIYSNMAAYFKKENKSYLKLRTNVNTYLPGSNVIIRARINIFGKLYNNSRQMDIYTYDGGKKRDINCGDRMIGTTECGKVYLYFSDSAYKGFTS